jgi:hypothetical protein
MKSISKIFAVIGLFLSLGASRAYAQTACFYEHDDYRGRSICLNDGDEIQDLRQWNFNDMMSSLQVARGYTAVLCIDHYFQGGCREFAGDVRSLSAYGLNDMISSIQIIRQGGRGGYPSPYPPQYPPQYPTPYPPQYPQPNPYPQPYPSYGLVCFYTGVNFRGSAYCLNQGEQNTALGGTIFNDSITSIQIPAGLQVIVCEHKNFGGRCLRLNRSVRNLSTFNFSNLISSMIVE